MDDLEQRVAAIIRNGAGAVLHQHEREAIARAIIPMVLEEAAKVADDYVGDPDDSRWVTAGNIAAAIRAIGAR